jgi:hypothetical protein
MYLGRLQRFLFGDLAHRSEGAITVPATLIEPDETTEEEAEDEEEV